MPKILVIDDDELICEMIASSLQLEGFETIRALDGIEGVEAARTHLPDLIVCDIVMPKLDGYGTLKALREYPATAMIPFIFLTGQSAKSDVRQGMVHGADDFLTKPVMIGELVAAIQARLQRQVLVKQETDRKLDELRVNLSISLPHEIRTPLSGIIGFAEVLRDDVKSLGPEEISEMAKIILKSATRLGHMVENFLTFAQLEMLAATSAPKAFVGKDTTVMFDLHIEEIADKKGKEYERPGDLKLSLGGAEASIATLSGKRIVEELVDNALKFSSRGQSIEIVTKAVDDFWELTVKDSGVGMELKDITQIGAYRQFQRKSREQQGSGLGLAIALKMSELYGGSLTIESEIAKGTLVTVRLPRPAAT
ncbi:MAG: response regulator [Ignavibacteriales bacterium]|nr:response regulator [Ignavibacteriales bacterium]